jgi:A/G-specific adenine glycosylase
VTRSKQISPARIPGLAPRLLRWYDRQRRDLPWRPPPGKRLLPDPYAVLVSEFMLQQTQVATVVPYFGRFLERFPTIQSLAAAGEQDVLRLWQGLGYYSRARNLLAAARKVVSDFGGEVPRSPEQLHSLPGVGPYTAGAIASIAFDCRAPILDGNVSRVLCRIEKITGDPRRPDTAKRLWQIAEGILPRRRCGDFNSALMELGAVICTPRQPACNRCPVRSLCKARAAGVQDKIPPPRRARPVPLEKRWTICVCRGDEYLIERRPSRGRWAGLWQFPTFEANGSLPSGGAIANKIGLSLDRLTRIGEIRHALTHRRYEFTAFTAVADSQTSSEPSQDRRWVRLENLDEYPLSRPQIRIAEMLRDSGA